MCQNMYIKCSFTYGFVFCKAHHCRSTLIMQQERDGEARSNRLSGLCFSDIIIAARYHFWSVKYETKKKKTKHERATTEKMVPKEHHLNEVIKIKHKLKHRRMKECAIIPKFMMLQKKRKNKTHNTRQRSARKKTLHEKQKRLF